MFKFILLLVLFYLIYYLIKNIVAGYKSHAKAKEKKQGKVTVDYTPGKKSKKDNNEIGEYVDYEEVDD